MPIPSDSLDQILAAVRGLMSHPAIDRLVTVNEWAAQNGIVNSKDELNAALADFFRKAPSFELAKEYIEKMTSIYVDLGPAVMAQMKNMGK